jgi:hypothetical protein
MQTWHDSHDANLILFLLCLVVRIDGLFANGQTLFEKAAIELLIVYDISNSSSRLAASESFLFWWQIRVPFLAPSSVLFLSLLTVQFVY